MPSRFGSARRSWAAVTGALPVALRIAVAASQPTAATVAAHRGPNNSDWTPTAAGGVSQGAHSMPKGAAGTGPSPVNRAKPGSKHHLLCDGNGTPIYVLTSGANVPDISRAVDLLDGYPPIAGRPGRPRRRFEVLLADKGHSSEAFRQACRERGTEPIIPRPKTRK